MSNKNKNIQRKALNTAGKAKQQPVRPGQAGSQSSLSSRETTVALLAGVVIIIFVCFRYTLHNSFLSDWDDWIYITKDKYITAFTAANFNSMLFHDITLNYYHPLTMLSLAVNYHFSQLNPWGYYFTNILLHSLNAILVFFFIKTLMEAMVKTGYREIPVIPWLAAVGALIHGIHPMHVESVSWIAERKDLMYAVFYFVGLIMYVRYLDGAKFKWMLYLNICLALACIWGIAELSNFSLDVTHSFYISDSILLAIPLLLLIAAIIVELKYKKINIGLFYIWEFFLISLFGKPMAVSFPLSIIAIDFLLKRDLKFISHGGLIFGEVKAFIKLSIEKWMFFVVAVLSGFQSVYLEMGHNTIAFTKGYTVIQKLLISSYAFTMYTVKAFFPVNLCSYYPYPGLTSEHYLPSFYYWAPWCALAIIFVPLYLTRKDKNLFRAMAFGLGFYFVNLVFILQFLSAGTTVMSERYSYVSYFGLIFMLVYLAHWLWSRNKSYHLAIKGSLAVLCFTLGYLCYQRTKVWHNPETLWTDVIDKMADMHPQVPYFNLGVYYVDSGKYNKAYVDYTILVKIGSKDPLVFRNLAMIYGIRKQFDSSIYYFARALQYDSNDATIYTNRAITYANLGKFDPALRDFSKAYSLDTTQNTVLAEKTSVLTQLGRYNDAVEGYNKLIQREPNELSYYLLRGNDYLNGGNAQMAVKDYLHVLESQPKNGECMYDMSIACHKLNDNARAIKYANMAQNAGYKLPGNYLNTLK